MFFSTAAVSSINSRIDTYLCKAAWRFGRALLLLKHTWIPRIYLYTVIHGNQKKKQKRRCRIRCAIFQAGESTVQGGGGLPLLSLRIEFKPQKNNYKTKTYRENVTADVHVGASYQNPFPWTTIPRNRETKTATIHSRE